MLPVSSRKRAGTLFKNKDDSLLKKVRVSSILSGEEENLVENREESIGITSH